MSHNRNKLRRLEPVFCVERASRPVEFAILTGQETRPTNELRVSPFDSDQPATEATSC